MKLNTAERASIVAALVLVAAVTGYCLSGRTSADGFTISTERTPSDASALSQSGDNTPDAADADSDSDGDAEQLSLNINTATADELTALPGIGEKLAARIVEYRNENGPFFVIEEIMYVSGIGEAIFDKIEQYITV